MKTDIENSSSRKSPCKLPKRGLIINPGAIGDCLLTLPLARFMKDALALAEKEPKPAPAEKEAKPEKQLVID
ncbi:MAG TPA: hypothetical protein ENH94_09605, partial [Phycisphaerales bacterium]|nr:hypothetical protein [Phycisphaerales bacterium]